MPAEGKKLRIGIMSYAMDNRRAAGTALYARKLIEELQHDESHEFTLIHYHPTDDPLYGSFKEILMPRVRLPYASQFVSQMLFFWKYRKQPFDIIHWLQPRLYPFYWLAPACSLVVTVHGAGQIVLKGQFDFSKSVFNFMMSRFNSSVAAFIAVSSFGQKEIIEHYHTNPKKTHLVYNGLNQDFRPIEKEEARAACKAYGIYDPFILDISRLQPHKNVISLVRAYDELRRTHPERREHLVIVGEDREAAAEVHAVAKASAYRTDIHFIAFVPDEHLNQLYSAAEVFVFPSLMEGFGLPLVEAMAAGTPFITSNVSALPEVAGDAGLLVPPTDIHALAEAMNKVLESESLREEMRAKGLTRAQDFTWKKTAEGTKRVYDAVA